MSIIIDGNLHIFNRFQIDKNLPKYAKVKSDDNDVEPQDSDESEVSWSTKARSRVRSSIVESSRLFFDPMDPDNDGMMVEMNSGFWDKVKQFFFGRKRKKEMSFEEIKKVFTLILNSLHKVDGIVKEYDVKFDEKHFIQTLIEYAQSLKMIKENGQLALYDKMVSNIHTFIYENLLKSCGYDTYIKQEDLIRFLTSNSKRHHQGFRLDWLKNYTRIIPGSIIVKKRMLDKLKIFDNYVVLHYDPKGVNSDLTKKEKEEIKKDPILFGVFQSSTNLYYVGDWIDEVCDLTFKEIIEHFKNEPGILNINLNTYERLLGDLIKTIREDLKDNKDIQEIIKVWL